MAKEKILIVDDEKNIVTSLQEILSDEGYEVATAEDGLEALELIQADPPDLILLDIWIPGMDGIELFKAARRIDRYDDEGQLPPLEFILITALRPSSSIQRKEASLLQEALSIGFVDVMLKPVDNDRLIHLLAKIEARLAGNPEPPDPTAANASGGSSAAAAPSRTSRACASASRRTRPTWP